MTIATFELQSSLHGLQIIRVETGPLGFQCPRCRIWFRDSILFTHHFKGIHWRDDERAGFK